MGEYYDEFDGSKCAYCRYRYSWDCDDGLAYPPKGCEDFKFDKETLNEEQRLLFDTLGLLIIENPSEWWE